MTQSDGTLRLLPIFSDVILFRLRTFSTWFLASRHILSAWKAHSDFTNLGVCVYLLNRSKTCTRSGGCIVDI